MWTTNLPIKKSRKAKSSKKWTCGGSVKTQKRRNQRADVKKGFAGGKRTIGGRTLPSKERQSSVQKNTYKTGEIKLPQTPPRKGKGTH